LAADNEASGFNQIERREPINITPAPEEQAAPLGRLKRSIADRAGEVIEPSTGEILEGQQHVETADTNGAV